MFISQSKLLSVICETASPIITGLKNINTYQLIIN